MKLGIVGVVGLLALALGCVSSPTPLDETWGSSVRKNTAAMIANPDAGKYARPVEGLDPATGELVMENYRTNQLDQEQDPRELFLIEQ